MWQRVFRPEYVFNPAQIFRKLVWRSGLAPRPVLPWGLPVEVVPRCLIGVDILNIGVFDLVVPEMIFRLLDPGEVAYDIGANIGQNTAAMAAASGPSGRVVAFEPHPELRSILERNVERWRAFAIAPTQVRPEAVSHHQGMAHLVEPAEFSGNSGSSAIGLPREGARSFSVATHTLDDESLKSGPPQLVKIDVEGHESQVLAGAEALLSSGLPRDILFEDTGVGGDEPGTLVALLKARGYQVFALDRLWGRPIVRGCEAGHGPVPNGLASRDPNRVVARLARPGWRCLLTRVRPAGVG